MNQTKTLAYFHLLLGSIIILMGILGIIGGAKGLFGGVDPLWFALVKIFLGILILGAGYKLFKTA